MLKRILILVLSICFLTPLKAKEKFCDFVKQFVSDYNGLGIPEFTYDYKEYFNSIPDLKKLNDQHAFFEERSKLILVFNPAALSLQEQITFDHINYVIGFNLERISLEKDWAESGRKVPLHGLHELTNYKEWYSFFIRKFTSLDTSPEDIMSFGIEEVKKVNKEINKIREKNGFADMESFYKHLHSNQFYYTDKKDILNAFALTDSSIRSNLSQFVGQTEIPEIYPMEWPDAGAYTPPGIYLNRDDNPYGKDVFQYNFYGHKYNKRAIDWIYMHEAIPGHHLQSSIRANDKDPLQDVFLYPGNFEGWACYVEYFGKELGVYTDDYSYLGKWEWDLIRSGRLVIETGIHYYGWSKEKAMEYWKNNIHGQDEIAEREIARVTNWPGQALTYKLGAKFIFDLRGKLTLDLPVISSAEFNRCYLSFGMCPLPVIEKNFTRVLNSDHKISAK